MQEVQTLSRDREKRDRRRKRKTTEIWKEGWGQRKGENEREGEMRDKRKGNSN